MATVCTTLLAVPLLLLTATPACSEQDNGVGGQQEDALVVAMKGVSQALECISNTMQEGVRLQKDLHGLPDMMVQMKEQMNHQNGNMESMKEELAALNKKDTDSEYIKELRNQLESKDAKIRDLQGALEAESKLKEQTSVKVEQLTESNAELRNQLEEREKKVQQLMEANAQLENRPQNSDTQVQGLERRLEECQLQVEQLQDVVQQLNETVVDQNTTLECTFNYGHEHQQEIMKLGQAFSSTSDWGAFRKGMEAVLDHSSKTYSQLQAVDYGSSHRLWEVGYKGYTQVATLLLCAEVPLDLADSDGSTMLYGAAKGDHLQLVKLLLDHGANPHVRNKYGNTPLMGAAYEGNLEVAQWLVQAGADSAARTKSGKTALDFARRNGHSKVVQYLEQLPH